MSGAAATAGERGVSLGAGVLQRWRHSIWTRIAEATIACQNIALAVAHFERPILAVPMLLHIGPNWITAHQGAW